MVETFATSEIFTQYILPFLLIFVIVFAVLEKTKIFGEDKKQTNAIAGFVIAMIFIGFFNPKAIVTNLVLFYKFLPAIWAVFSALALFFLVYKKTNDFYLGILAIIFFASIKSNLNLLGLWFFTPLTFSIPFILLYIYFFTEGIEKRDNQMIFWSWNYLNQNKVYPQ